MTTDKHPHIWEQREKESGKAYAAFLLYRDLGRGSRSIEQAVQIHRKATGKGLEKNWEKWSARHEWVKRCKAWDMYQQSLDEKALEDLRQQKRVEIVNAELEDYERLRAQWLEQSKAIRPVDMRTDLEDGRHVLTIKTTPYEFRAHIEARKKISEGLRLFAELPSNIDRHEQTGAGGKALTIKVVRDDDGYSNAQPHKPAPETDPDSE
jgi:hypothetical protein